MATRYARRTEVPVKRSRAQIETLLENHGAEGFAYGWDSERDRIEFALKRMRIRMDLGRLNPNAFRTRKDFEQADRQRWRALHLVIRAKLEAIESGLSVFEEEFLSFIVTASGTTVGEVLLPQLTAGTPPRTDRLQLPAAVVESS